MIGGREWRPPGSGAWMAGTVVPVTAHHAFAAEFDADKPVEFSGTVTQVEWINPHVWIHVDVTGDDGAVESWAFEAGHAERVVQARLHAQLAPARHRRQGRRVSGEGRHQPGERSRHHVRRRDQAVSRVVGHGGTLRAGPTRCRHGGSCALGRPARLARFARDARRRGLPLAAREAFVWSGCFALGLAAFGFLDAVQTEPRASVVVARRQRLLLVAWSVGLFGLARRTGRTLTLEVVLRTTALHPSRRAGRLPAVLGLVLASGLRLGVSHRRAAGLRLRVRHAAGLVATRYLHGSALARSRSSSVSTCSSGLRTTGSTCSSC